MSRFATPSARYEEFSSSPAGSAASPMAAHLSEPLAPWQRITAPPPEWSQGLCGDIITGAYEPLQRVAALASLRAHSARELAPPLSSGLRGCCCRASTGRRLAVLHHAVLLRRATGGAEGERAPIEARAPPHVPRLLSLLYGVPAQAHHRVRQVGDDEGRSRVRQLVVLLLLLPLLHSLQPRAVREAALAAR